ncbi:hypothetical protein [Paracoccus sp. (in: a-proteobacteria)]|uniref:hypothetical protein n=1 Tax=Paracoccus sp. TaxID=267 RepID=UPI0026DEE180|nr:hypothetical protein [Paracoccus sp. (in: a-proteobacteria)]MDO5371096.1 hypothetical protein [Paracoccus sp. (in: a-proteobacteria)]
MTDFTIEKLTVIDGEPNYAGNRLLASFTVVMPWITIRGCVLVEKATGIVRAYGPLGKTPRGHAASAELTDATLARAITRRAAVIYGAYTGREVSDE